MRSLCHTTGITPTFVYYIFLALTTAHAAQLAGRSQLQHNMQKKIGEVILKKTHKKKKSCFTYLSKVIIKEFSNTKIQEKRPEKKHRKRQNFSK